MEGPVVDSLTAAPAPQLRALVGSYSGSRLQGFAPGTHRGLPSRHLTVVISLDTPVHLTAMTDRSQAPGSFAALAAGLRTEPAAITHDGSEHTVSVELTPAGARSLLGLPAAELAGAVVDLAELLGPNVRELAERMAGARAWPERFAVLDKVLSACVGRTVEADRTMAYAWRRLLDSGGNVRVAELADEIGYSRRQLTQRFTREYGLTPKQAARVVRFERSWLVLRRLERLRRVSPDRRHRSLASVAATCGYYDQAHMAREWNDLAGCPPSAWLAAEELPFVQDSTAELAVA
jgi:AraC-like DNA-binding protein